MKLPTQCFEGVSEVSQFVTAYTGWQAVALSMTSFQAMARVVKHYRGRFTTVVGFRPTGWSLGAAKKAAGGGGGGRSAPQRAARGSRSQKGNLVSYQVCADPRNPPLPRHTECSTAGSCCNA